MSGEVNDDEDEEFPDLQIEVDTGDDGAFQTNEGAGYT